MYMYACDDCGVGLTDAEVDGDSGAPYCERCVQYERITIEVPRLPFPSSLYMRIEIENAIAPIITHITDKYTVTQKGA